MELPSYPNNRARQAYPQPYYIQPSQPIPQAAPQTQSIQSQPVILQNQDLDQAKYQVQRWANWVRFVSIFIMVKALLGLISSVYYLFVVKTASNPEFNQMQPLDIFVQLFILLVGASGYRAAVKKTAGSALCYMIMLLGEIVVSAYAAYIVIQMVIDGICSTKVQETNENLVDCDQEFNDTVYIASGIVFGLCTLLVCVPVLICPCKLYRHAKYVEKRERLRPVYPYNMAYFSK